LNEEIGEGKLLLSFRLLSFLDIPELNISKTFSVTDDSESKKLCKGSFVPTFSAPTFVFMDPSEPLDGVTEICLAAQLEFKQILRSFAFYSMNLRQSFTLHDTFVH
jgi:hypothetical protein